MVKLLWMIAAGAAGYYGYRKFQGMGSDVRPRQGRGIIESAAVDPGVSSSMPSRKTAELPSPLDERIIRRVREKPGILQTEFYALFPEENRRVLQEMLRTMDQKGGVKRTKEGGTYRLYPAESRH